MNLVHSIMLKIHIHLEFLNSCIPVLCDDCCGRLDVNILVTLQWSDNSTHIFNNRLKNCWQSGS
jgi:hypothetical protein